MEGRMTSLGTILDWSTRNTQPDSQADADRPRPMEKLDPELIDMILGKSDAVKMKV